jgi:hypothetical protein
VVPFLHLLWFCIAFDVTVQDFNCIVSNYSEHWNTGLVLIVNGPFVSESGMVSGQTFKNRTHFSSFKWSAKLDHLINITES